MKRIYLLKLIQNILIAKTVFNYFFSGGEDNGYFGPWKTCKILMYNRERCGTNVSKFRPKGKEI